jgi:glycosyltransferase involved in cell wall biosynthesis
LSQYSINQLAEYYSPDLADKAVSIPAGVDINRFAPAANKQHVRKQLGLPTNSVIFFTLRNLMPRMGLEQLIEAVSLLKEKKKTEHNPVILYIGGKGPLYKRLREKITDSGLDDDIKMVGFISDEELPAYYQAVDFFVLPTEDLEGFGIVTIEALACNTPVIATPVGATPEILEHTGGFLTQSTEPEELASVMDYAAEKRQQILGKWDSRSVIEAKYSWAVIGKRIETLFTDMQQKYQRSQETYSRQTKGSYNHAPK